MARAGNDGLFKSFKFIGLGEIGPSLTEVMLNGDEQQVTFVRGAKHGINCWNRIPTTDIVAGVIMIADHDHASVEKLRKGEVAGREIWFERAKVLRYEPFDKIDAGSSDIVREKLIVSYDKIRVSDRE